MTTYENKNQGYDEGYYYQRQFTKEQNFAKDLEWVLAQNKKIQEKNDAIIHQYNLSSSKK